MASPQKENGHTQIAHEILMQTALFSFSGSQSSILLIVWRFTYGFNRKSHEFSVSFLTGATGLSERSVKRELSFLIDSCVILVTQKATNKKSRKLAFNKDYDSWKVERRGEKMKHGDFFGVTDLTPQNNNLGVTDLTPLGVTDLTPQTMDFHVLGVTDLTPKKDIKKKTLKKDIKENVEILFNDFYKAYPRRIAREAALKAWNKLSKLPDFDPDKIILHTMNYTETCKLLKREKGFIEYPSTFLNQKRYEDYNTIDPEGLASTSITKNGTGYSSKKQQEFESAKNLLNQWFEDGEDEENGTNANPGTNQVRLS